MSENIKSVEGLGYPIAMQGGLGYPYTIVKLGGKWVCIEGSNFWDKETRNKVWKHIYQKKDTVRRFLNLKKPLYSLPIISIDEFLKKMNVEG